MAPPRPCLRALATAWVGAASLLALPPAQAEAPPGVRLAAVFGEHMVLQRERPLRLWGWAAPGQVLQVSLARHSVRVRAGADGRWAARLPALPAGGPHRLRVQDSQGRALELHDVLVGDVWLLGGQSNMEWPLSGSDTGAAEAAGPQNAQLRQLRVPLRASLRPQADIAPAPWVVAEPGRVGEFSAVGYHFARHWQTAQGVPVGLIQTAWGGSHLETWLRRDAALQEPTLAAAVQALPDSEAAHAAQRRRQALQAVQAWQAQVPGPVEVAPADSPAWAAPGAAVAAGWPQLRLPGLWEGQGLPGVDGVVWLRRRIELDAAQAAGAAELHLGRVDDCDEVWLNGQRLGGQCGYDRTRRYTVPPGTLRAGENWVVLRITDLGGGGGVQGDPDALRLDTVAGRVPLAGAWSARLAELRVSPAPTANDAPTLAHNGLIAPLQGLPVRGVLWYQGESNTGRAAAYAQLFPRLIEDWRAQWQAPRLPFYFVQLAAFLPLRNNVPGRGGWAELREAQAQALALPHTGMAVALDVGDEHDIHPRDKRSLGQRLAALALADAGLRSAPASGPRLLRSERRGAELWLHFTATGGGLRPRRAGEALRGFLLAAGPDGPWVAAEARLVGPDTVALSSPAVPAPVAARYAWVDNPSEANLHGGDGLPAAPLRTDRWPLPSTGRHWPD